MEEEILKLLHEFAEKLPKFPDGRIDYSNSDVAPVITIFIRYGDKILLLRRSGKVGTYKGKWNTVAGYLDEVKPIREKVLEELLEEVGIREDEVSSINFGESYKFVDQLVNRTWIVYPVLVDLKERPEIKLNWEHEEYRWIDPKELKNYDTVPKLEESLKRVLNLN